MPVPQNPVIIPANPSLIHLFPTLPPPSLQRRNLHYRSFVPKYDFVEHADSFSLHGELPGVLQEDVIIEFTDPQTLTIRGRSERSYLAMDLGPSAHQKEQGVEGEEAVVKDDKLTGSVVVTDGRSYIDKEKLDDKYWLFERSVGDFGRSFLFHVRVDQKRVRAFMENGILTVMIPKSQKRESHIIALS